MGSAFSSPLSVAGDGGDNAREDEEGAGTANCTVHGNHKPQEKNDLLPQEDGDGDGLMAPNDRELEGVRQQQESGFNSQQKRQTMPSMISSSSSNKRNRTSNDKEAPTMVTTTTTATRKMTGLDTVATIAMTHPKNPNKFCSPQPDEKGPNNGAAAPPPVQQRRRRRRLRDRQPQQPQYNRVMSKSSSSKKKKKKQRLMPGHNTNAEQGPPRVAAAEDEGYDTTARALLTKEGFDPDDLKKNFRGYTPMTRFCCLGELAMCRYLVFRRGADCRQTDETGSFPMYYAAANGHLEICELLLHHGGAHDDFRKQDRDGWSPLCAALIYKQFDVAKWLIRNGALATFGDVDGGVIDDAIMRNDLNQLYWDNDRRLPLLSWARDAVTTHDNDVKILLTGMIVSSKQTSSSLAIFNGKSGILKLIADYAVAGTPQQLRTLRQLADRLSAFIEDVPFIEDKPTLLVDV